MTLASMVFLLIIVVPLFLCSCALLPFYIKNFRIFRSVERLPADALAKIHELITNSSETQSGRFVYVNSYSTSADNQTVIPLPNSLGLRPWAGRILVEAEGEAFKFEFNDSLDKCARINGKNLRAIELPVVKLKSGKVQGVDDPKRLIAQNALLRSALEQHFPRYPVETLGHILQIGKALFEFDSGDQIRVGGFPNWIQPAEFPCCEKCKSRPVYLAQIPGYLLKNIRAREAVIYLFSCKKHSDEVILISQYY